MASHSPAAPPLRSATRLGQNITKWVADDGLPLASFARSLSCPCSNLSHSQSRHLIFVANSALHLGPSEDGVQKSCHVCLTDGGRLRWPRRRHLLPPRLAFARRRRLRSGLLPAATAVLRVCLSILTPTPTPDAPSLFRPRRRRQAPDLTMTTAPEPRPRTTVPTIDSSPGRRSSATATTA